MEAHALNVIYFRAHDTDNTNRILKAGPDARCQASVVIPVCNEEEHLPSCLQALASQSLAHHLYEVIVLLNNCTDSSARIARQFQQAHPTLALHPIELWLPKNQANVGTARRLLMEEASRRLPASGAILSTDGDTVVEHDWVERNLDCLNKGADAVGGDISLHRDSYAKLPATSRRQYREDHSYLEAVTRLESILDPDPFDPWPRHHHHFGASLACTNSLYTRLGGLPKADCLEDVAFVNAMGLADARLRHSPAVKVVTAARTSGRARIGLASQLREWHAAHADPLVNTAAFLTEYFVCRAELRAIWKAGTLMEDGNLQALATQLGMDRKSLRTLADGATTFGNLLEALDLRGRKWRRADPLRRVGKRSRVTEQIGLLIRSLLSAKHQSGIALPGFRSQGSTHDALENIHAPDLPWRDSLEQMA